MNKKDSAIIRKREAEVAQRLSPSWNAQDAKPVLSPEGISYEVSEKTGAISYGGLGLLQQVVKWSGLGKAIDEAVKLLKRHQPYHESDHVLSLIYNVATGGTRYQDVEMRRQSGSFLEAVGAEKIPAPSTAGDFVRRFKAPDVLDLMEAVNDSRLKVWAQQPASPTGSLGRWPPPPAKARKGNGDATGWRSDELATHWRHLRQELRRQNVLTELRTGTSEQGRSETG